MSLRKIAFIDWKMHLRQNNAKVFINRWEKYIVPWNEGHKLVTVLELCFYEL